jgi:hypothetical protein
MISDRIVIGILRLNHGMQFGLNTRRLWQNIGGGNDRRSIGLGFQILRIVAGYDDHKRGQKRGQNTAFHGSGIFPEIIDYGNNSHLSLHRRILNSVKKKAEG